MFESILAAVRALTHQAAGMQTSLQAMLVHLQGQESKIAALEAMLTKLESRILSVVGMAYSGGVPCCGVCSEHAVSRSIFVCGEEL